MRWTWVVVAGFLLVACAPDATPAGGCPAGQWECFGSTARQCDGKGGYSVETECAGTATPVCVAELGCRACTPGALSCVADAPEAVQKCSADGMTLTAAEACDFEDGYFCAAGACMDQCATDASDYRGCEYYATVMANSQLDVRFTYAVVLANPHDLAVTVHITGGGLTTASVVTIAANAVTTVELPWVDALLSKRPMCFDPDAPDPYDCSAKSAQVAAGAYHIVANLPISVYQFNPLHYSIPGSTPVYSYTNDASLLLPVRALRQHYLVATYENWSNDTQGIYGDPVTIVHGGTVSVVATGAAHVHVVLSANVSDPASPYDTLAPGAHDFTLAAGDVVQLAATDAMQDLTGTSIDADAPVAVFAGHDCTQIPDGRPACDHLEEQLLPDETWGTRTLVTQLRDRGSDEASVVKLVSRDDGNVLTFDGIDPPAGCPAMLDRGEFCQFQTAASFAVRGSKPFLALQMMIGQGLGPHYAEVCVMHSSDPLCTDPIFGGPDNWCASHADDDLCEGFKEWCELRPTKLSCVGDPAMVTEIPVDQYRADYDFLVPDTYVYNIINVTAPRDVSIMLDGQDLAARTDVITTAVGAADTLYVVPITPGAHHAVSGSRFGIKVYGVARYTSYAYPAGLDLTPINPIE